MSRRSPPVLRTDRQLQAQMRMTNDDVVERLVREIPPPEIPKFEQK